MFITHRSVRRWAAWVVLPWLFGVAMGVANACALGGRSESGHRGTDAHAPPLGQETADNDFAVSSPMVRAEAAPAPSQASEPSVDQLEVDSSHLHSGPPPRIAFRRFAL
jgi:hypothetical protein